MRALELKPHVRHPIVADREEYLLGTGCAAARVGASGFVGAIAVSVPTRRFAAGPAEGDRIGREQSGSPEPWWPVADCGVAAEGRGA